MSKVWSFETAKYRISLHIEPEYGYRYDGDDPDGEIQRKLDNGAYEMFNSTVKVIKNGHVVGTAYLGASVYDSNKIAEFWTAHRDPDPMNRNCSIMRAKSGEKVNICHYFPDLVREAIAEARKTLDD